jgi:hypothetical protein
MSKYTSVFLAAALLAGCTSSNGQHTEAPALPAKRPAVESEPEAPTAVDEAARKLARRLAVRHTEDLPGADELRELEGAVASLVWVAGNADTMVVRARALALLRHVPSPEGRAALVSHLQPPSPHPTLRAAAVRGLEPFDGDADVLALLTAALRDGDLRVAHAAATVLSADPAHLPILEAAAQDPAVGESLRAKINNGSF